jgi:putative transposase
MNKARLIPNTYYQFSQKIRGTLLFTSHDDYLHFLFLYCRHIQPIARTFAYCLLPDSFHVLLQIRDWSSLLRHTERVGEDVEILAADCPGYLERKVSHFVTRYHTSLTPASASEADTVPMGWQCECVTTEAEMAHRLGLLHLYPLYYEEGACNGLWPYTSLHSLQSHRHTFLDRDTVHAWFGGYENFLRESRVTLAECF